MDQERYVEAALRETKEETGVTVIPKGIINVVSNQFANGINSLVIVILAKPESTVVTPGDDIIKADWFDLKSGQQICAIDLDGFSFKAV